MAEGIEPVRVETALGQVAVHVLGAGRPTVLWHALFVDGSSWGYVVSRLLPGRRLLLVDGPGWGRSAPLRRVASESQVVAAAARVVEQLAPDATVDWVGNGWGGRIGMQLAATRSDLVRSLVAVGASPAPAEQEQRRRFRRVLPLLRLVGPLPPAGRLILTELLTDTSRTEPATVGAVLDALALAGRRSVALSIRSALLRRTDITGLLPRIQAPSLFVAGDDGGDWSPEQAADAAALAPRARAVTVPGSRTLVPLEQPQLLATLIRDFWSTLDVRPEGS